MMRTRGVILAAGRGSRMEAVTADRPKCLVELGGKPLLHWQVQAMHNAGIQDLLVVTGYRGEMVAGPFEVVENPRWSESNMVTSMTCADPWLRSGECIVSYADIVYRSSHLTSLLDAREDIALTYDRQWESLWRIRNDNPLDDAETFSQESGLVREIGGRPRHLAEVQGQYMGLVRTTPAGWRVMASHLHALSPDTVDGLDMTALLRLLLANGVRIAAVPVDGGWCEVDNQKDVLAYEELIRQADSGGPLWDHDFRQAGNTQGT